MHLPLNALRAFEVSARQLSFTRAAAELNVTQTAVSQHVKNLEERMGAPLFRRLPRGLALTDEGTALLAELGDSFGRIGAFLDNFNTRRIREVLTVGSVGTFALGWLLPRLQGFAQRHPNIDLRLMTHNNRVDIASEGLDFAIRFGDGAWHGTHAQHLMRAPLWPVCSPALAARLRSPDSLREQPLLRSYRADEWARWFTAAGVACPVVRGAVFDSSLALAEAAVQGHGVALLPARMFAKALQQGSLIRPFDIHIATGSYWLTRLHSKLPGPAMNAFSGWLEQTVRAEDAVNSQPNGLLAAGEPVQTELQT